MSETIEYSQTIVRTTKMGSGKIIALGLGLGVVVLIGALVIEANSPIEQAKRGLSNSLYDPRSADFADVRLQKSPLGDLVCGYVNAKNRLGGYVGKKPFVYVTGMREGYVIAGKQDAFVYGDYIKHCFPSLPIPANALEASRP